jgi:hypothetical protein
MSEEWKVERGRMIPKKKIFLGLSLILVICTLIWFPLGFFAFSDKIGMPNIPIQMEMQIGFDDYNPIYFMTSRSDNIHPMGPFYQQFTSLYTQNSLAEKELIKYGSNDIAISSFAVNSKATWSISPPDFYKLTNDLLSNETVTCQLQFSFFRKEEKQFDEAFYSYEYQIPTFKENKLRQELLDVLLGKRESVEIPWLMPKFLRLQTLPIIEPAVKMAPGFAKNCKGFFLDFSGKLLEIFSHR